MSYHPSNLPLNGVCRVCSGTLAKEVKTIHNEPTPAGGSLSNVVKIETTDYYAYVNPPTAYETQAITKVWCTGCGVMYNPQ